MAGAGVIYWVYCPPRTPIGLAILPEKRGVIHLGSDTALNPLMKSSKDLPHYAIIDVPIYDAVVKVLVTNLIYMEREKLSNVLGPPPKPDYDSLCSTDFSGMFWLFFTPKSLTNKAIAHELWHLTVRILEWSGDPNTPQYQEPGARLNGFLHEEFYKLPFLK